MSTDRERIKEVLAEAAARNTPAERAAYLDGACREDDELRAEVERLLQAHGQAGAFLEEPVAPPQPSTIVLSFAPTEQPGERIGRYKLLQQIGEGGCGVVYMAEQEEPIRRRVAFKVIKLGMDTKAVIARFEAERQALALMDHPNIAKVLDAGATDTGRPYFVMELVRGIKITEYCDQNNLSTEERLDLFVQICHAIQHAHQKGIIHRDIKPSNILVTVHDGKPLPKIIDFGIAKATSGQVLTDKTLFTAFEQFIGTPAYMSPEQAEMSPLDIDTRSDIYALGVLLYELLTGRTPFVQEELVAAGLSEMRRIIREREPLRPSTCLSTLAAADQTTVARRRQSEPPQLIHSMRGDLDWIVMKCLEKDRTRRYQTANGLANDVMRHLHDEPVTARPPGGVYRLQKLVRRHKLVFAVGVAVTAALVVGLALSTWFFFQERAARQRAVAAEQKTQTEAKKSQQVAQFLQNMLKGVGPSAAMGRDTTMLREILDKTSEGVGKELKDSPEVEAELRTTLGEVYQALGQFTKAEEMFRAALVIRRGLWGNMNTNVADSLANLVKALEWQMKAAEAEPLVLEALTIRTNLLGDEHCKVAESLAALSVVRLDQGRFTEAEELSRHALALRRKLLGNESLDVADSLVDLGSILITESRVSEAEAVAREALAIQKRLLGEECPDPNLGTSQILLGRVLRVEGKNQEAETSLRPIIAMRRKLVGSESLLVAYPNTRLEAVLDDEGKLDEAEQVGREALATYRRLKASNTPEGAAESAWCMWFLGDVLHKKGQLHEAEAMFREVYDYALTSPNAHSQFQQLNLGWGGGSLVTVLREEGKLDQAEAFCRDAVASQRKLLTSSDDNFSTQQLALVLGTFADVLHAQGKLVEAEAVFREALGFTRKLPASDIQAIALGYMGDSLRDQGKLAEAEPLYREGLNVCHQLATNNFERRQWLAGGLAVTLKQQGRWAEAETFYREALTNSAKLWPDDFQKWEWQFNDLIGVLQRQGKTTELEALYREGLGTGEKLPVSTGLANLLAVVADRLRDQGKLAEAEPLYREGLNACHQLATNNSELRQWLAGGLALTLKQQGRWAEAETFYREALTNSAKLWPDDFQKWEWQFNDLIGVLQRQGKSNEVERLQHEFRLAAVPAK